MADRPRMTLADYLVIAVSPALVMAMVGSLVFFLVELFYQGQYEVRLRFVLAMFVVGAVLIGRISIELGTERATLYAMPLAVATALAINRFVVGQGGHLGALGLAGNLALLGLVWWAAHKLVWDCTFIDESRDYTGEGLLQAAGLQKTEPQGAAQDQPAAEVPADGELPEHAEPQRAADRRTPWWSRFHRYRSRAHPPGVWIVYFGLVALPVFGLGQALIPQADAARRAYGFRLLLVYAASTLGLLLLTSFLGLRRYLRQRWLTMPARMAATWVATGTMLILAVLTVALLLPRPAAELSWDDLARTIARKGQHASRMAWGLEGTEDPRFDRARITQPLDAADSGQAQGKPRATTPRPGTEETAAGQETSAAAEDGQLQKTAPSGKAAGSKEPLPGPAASPDSRPQGMPKGRPKPQHAATRHAEAPASPLGSPVSPSRTPSGSRSPSAESPPQSARSEGQSPSAGPPPTPPTASQSVSSTWPQRLAGLIVVLKWAFYVAIAAAVGFWIIRHGRQILAEIGRLLAELGAWWASLFGRKAPNVPGATLAESAPPGTSLPRLADYADPFLSGAAENMRPDALVRYSFEALEAWGRQHGCPRGADQTPAEFAQAVGRAEPTLASHARTLAGLYCRAAYAADRLTARDVEPLRELWQRLRWTAAPLVDTRQPTPLA